MDIPAIPPPFVLATLAADAGWWDRIAYQINGLAVVFIALGTIWGAMEFIGWLFRLGARRAALVPTPGSAATTRALEQLSPETVAVISAAVAAAIDQRHIIRAINPGEHDPAWAREGRREVFESHRVR